MIKLYRLKTCFVFALLLACFQASAQETVTGRVRSGEDNLGLPGVSVLQKGTTHGTAKG